MLRQILLAAALLLAPAAALAQDGVYRPGLPTTDTNPPPSKCVVWSGTAYVPCGGGSGSATPTGTAGSPNAAVVSVQGVSGGTPQNVTVTNQPATGTAGTPATTVLTVQGIASGTPLNATLTNSTIANTIADGADVAEGATSATAYAGSGACTVISCLKGVYTGLYAATPTGANTIGRVLPTIDATNTGSALATVTSAVAAGQVLKAGAGNLYGLNVVSGGTAGYVLITNTTTVPADGAVTPVKCYVLAANSSLDLNFRATPTYFATGITVSFSTTGCFSKTGSATAFISGDVK